jgi:uncharacterized protein (DUF885 family)
MISPRELADRFHSDWLEVHPFDASNYGIPGYDDRVPDASEVGEAAWRDRVEELLGEANAVDTSKLSEADKITLSCLVIEAEQEIALVESKAVEHTVTPMPFSGPAWLLAVAARSVIVDAEAAGDYLERLQKSGRWIDQVSERLRTGAQKGRLPVAPLVEQAIAWAESALASDETSRRLGRGLGVAAGEGQNRPRCGEAGDRSLGRSFERGSPERTQRE